LNCWEKKEPENVVAEIAGLQRRDIHNFAFYDDALFVDADNHIVPILESIKQKTIDVYFHSPNGLHARYVTPRLARLLKETGFVMPRLSLETANAPRQKISGGKVATEDFLTAVSYIKEAGYAPGEFIAYIMMGMPGQSIEEVEESIAFAHNAGARVSLAEYSPIPGTKDWQAVQSKLPSSDPLWHNNSLFPLFSLSDWPRLQKVKNMAKELNKSLAGHKE
jgi:radical SAM superfamily enzyme YgiQ (UPF0313 family)